MVKPDIPSSESSARAYAKEWVRYLMGRGYTCDDIDREVFMGYCAPGHAGYGLSHGKIIITNWHVSPTMKWTFSFRKLSEELNQPEQAMLF